MGRRVLENIIYWGHVGIMTAFFFSGFFFSLPWVILFYLIIELQLAIFNGCSITLLQQKMGDLQTDEDFIPALFYRFFKVEITERQHMLFSYFIMSFPVYVGIVRVWFF